MDEGTVFDVLPLENIELACELMHSCGREKSLVKKYENGLVRVLPPKMNNSFHALSTFISENVQFSIC